MILNSPETGKNFWPIVEHQESWAMVLYYELQSFLKFVNNLSVPNSKFLDDLENFLETRKIELYIFSNALKTFSKKLKGNAIEDFLTANPLFVGVRFNNGEFLKL